ncbi:Hsp70 family protein [Aeromonas allosaccharophila]
MNNDTTTPSRHQPDFIAHYQDVLVDFTNSLGRHRFWHICPLNSEEPCGLFDAETGLKYPPLHQLKAFIKSNPFLYVLDHQQKQLATFETKHRLLWHNDGQLSIRHTYSTAIEKMKQYQTPGLSGWMVPSIEEFRAFWALPGNPHRTGVRLHEQYAWFTREYRCDIDDWTLSDVNNTNGGYIYARSNEWQQLSIAKLMAAMVSSQHRLITPDTETSWPTEDNSWQPLSHEALLREIYEAGLCLKGVDIQKQFSNPINELYLLDWTPCRLPKLETPRLSDPNKGLWELWGADKSELDTLGLVARDPARDIKLHNVAIDFGTSSTVVAYCDEHGARQLLRIGVRDFYQAPQASHYENPTVLELLDYQQFIAIWQQQAYRPALDWSWLRASHEARESFRSNPGDTRVIASILPRIKQWAMRSEKERLRLTDYQGWEMALPSLTERNPVGGEPMQVNEQYLFDPVELYAWYLGMAINWRERGLYLKYHMTFPAKYERATKDKILASFRRGLQRSLPISLVNQTEILRQFEVRELASEPAAYAAAALPQLELTLDDEGIAYAVFDFGGGTTDFDFGLWRWATEEEEAEGYEQVFESIHSSGDNFLGGENLLEHLVYDAFQYNLDVCREHKIHFTRPIDGERFAGDEAFVQPTQAAQTNTAMLASALRPFMEGEDGKLEGQLKMTLLDVDGQLRQCELILDKEDLDDLLEDRIEDGLIAFLQELAHVVDQFAGKTVHVLLAGNGSRSRHLAQLLDANLLQELLVDVFGETPPKLEIHPPLAIDEEDHHSPTAKTGVALGLLRLCPGEGVKLIDRVRSSCSDEAPFRYYVGGVRRGQFDAKLTPTSGREGWTMLGVMPQKVFKLCYSQSPRARSGMAEGDPELLTRRIDFPAAPLGAKIFVRAIQPGIIELAAAQDESALPNNTIAHQKLDLDTGLMMN